jgi:hypothetical protein
LEVSAKAENVTFNSSRAAAFYHQKFVSLQEISDSRKLGDSGNDVQAATIAYFTASQTSL